MDISDGLTSGKTEQGIQSMYILHLDESRVIDGATLLELANVRVKDRMPVSSFSRSCLNPFKDTGERNQALR